ncbi:hypothetical protein PoB_004278000 [Plakobranchus ocellatus]|uniref:Yippee domain-containing protein n=1 Tax=Plakobranchus ocellatus TaxID=259542 RepID=A0AAV4BB03_9GAST|nr:hypothetical protein PoB_004278000 [Plakobranchus ocellatus]
MQLKTAQANLTLGRAVALSDFAENYHCDLCHIHVNRFFHSISDVDREVVVNAKTVKGTRHLHEMRSSGASLLNETYLVFVSLVKMDISPIVKTYSLSTSGRPQMSQSIKPSHLRKTKTTYTTCTRIV